MKTSVIYLIAISFLFQSCYTYRAIDLKDTPLFTDRNYKIKLTDKSEKVKLLSVNDTTLIVLKDNTEKTIQVSKIKEIKEGKFSTLKTTGLVTSLGLATLVIIGAVVMSNFTIGDFTIPTN